jgi:NADPH2:quinone reductase
MPGVTDIPGLEVAGVIVAGDLGDSGFRPGDAVCALLPGGGYAEYCTAPLGQCLPIPKGLTMAEAASLPEAFFTVWSNIYDRAHLQRGQTLLVHGGTSGIGVTAIQIATALGSQVWVTAGSDEKCRACEALGAVRAINYRTEQFEQVVKEDTSSRGVDVILDMVGGDYLSRDIDCLADDGRIVLISMLGGPTGSLDLAQLMRRRLTVSGSMLRSRSVAVKAVIAAKLRYNVWPLLEAGAIKPVLFAHFPLEKAAAAHQLMEGGGHIGKIVLVVQD